LGGSRYPPESESFRQVSIGFRIMKKSEELKEELVDELDAGISLLCEMLTNKYKQKFGFEVEIAIDFNVNVEMYHVYNSTIRNFMFDTYSHRNRDMMAFN
jgi:hypothetical protein